MSGSGMSPEALETRFAELRQRVNDFIETVTERFRISDEQVERRFRELDHDLRSIAPVVRDVDKLRDGQQRNNDKLAGLEKKVDAIHKRLDTREEDQRSRNRQLWMILIGVLGTSAGGLLIQLLHVGASSH